MNVSGVVFWIVVAAAVCGAVIFMGLIGVVLAADAAERDEPERWR